MNSKPRLLISTVWFGLASVVYIALFSRRTDVMSGDAQLSAMLSNYQISDFGKTLSLRSDMLFGAGGLQGGFLFWLDPVSVIGSIGSLTYNHFLVALVSSIAIFVLATKLFETFDVSGFVSVSAAAFTSIATLWGYSVALVDNELFGHVPQYASLLIVSLAILNCFLRVNGENRARDLAFGLGFVTSVLFLFVVLPHLLVTSLPLLIIIGVSSMSRLLIRREQRAFVNRLSLLIFSTVVLLLLKAPIFLNGFYRYTAASEMPLSVYNQPQIWPLHRFVFETFFPTPSAEGNQVFQLICFLILSVFLIRGVVRQTRRSQVWTMSVIAALFLLLYRIWQSTWDFESGPRISYFIWMLSPLYAIAITSFVFEFARNNFRNAYKNLKQKSNLLVVAVASLILIALFMSPLTSLRFSLEEPLPRSLDELSVIPELLDRVSLLDGGEFRGRVAYVLQEPDYPLNISGRIPLLNEYSHTLTPLAFKFYEKFLLDEDSQQLRNRFVLGLQNFDIYRMVGVRYLVVPKINFDSRSQTLVDDDFLISDLGDENVLIDLGTPNLGTYSPISVGSADSLTTTFELIDNGSFDATKRIVIEGSAPTDLVAANLTKFQILDGDVFVSAKSPGRSMILLPIEFSNCLSIDSKGEGIAEAKIVRANGFLTALTFDKEFAAIIKLRTGLFDNPSCRNQDLKEFRLLNI
ncbi:MAG: hypothetical protein ACKO82_02110 [Acidimicrobiaceae bacterium]